MKLILSGDLMRRAHYAVSKEETRYYLQGVAVTPAKDGGLAKALGDKHDLLAPVKVFASADSYEQSQKDPHWVFGYRSPHKRKGFGLLMPMRESETEADYPTWAAA